MSEPLLLPSPAEILPPGAGLVGVVAVPHPFRSDRIAFTVPAGMSVAEIVAMAQPDRWLRAFAHVSIGDQVVVREHYHRIRPRPGTRVTVRVLPGKKKASGGKGVLGVILSIVTVVAAIAVPALVAPVFGLGAVGTAVVKGLIAGAISIVGGMAMNALAPPSKPKLGALSAPSRGIDQDSPTLSLTGARNTVRPFAPIPVILGRHWQVPALGAPLYTEIVGDDQYLRMAVIWGIGPLSVTNVKIGDTPISSFSGVERQFRRGYQPGQITDKGTWASTAAFPGGAEFGDRWIIPADCTIQGRALTAGDTITYNATGSSGEPNSWDINDHHGLGLYPYSVVETPEQIELTPDWQTRTTPESTDQITVDFVFYRGLVRFGDQAEKLAATVYLDIEYAPAGTGAWSQHGTIEVTSAQTSAVRRTAIINVTRGQYDIRFRRQNAASTDTRLVDDCAVTATRAVRFEPPFDFYGSASRPGLCCEVIRIKASEQLQGAIEDLSGICHSIGPDWDGARWRWRPTNNPASLLRLVLEGRGSMVPAVESGIDLDQFRHFHEFCSANGFTFNHVVDYDSSIPQIATDIAASARAALTRIDNKYSVVIDEPKTVPVQVFTPRNSRGFRSEIVYPDLPHGYRVQFVDPDSGKGRERIVYDDGYDANNATLFEILQPTGVTDPVQIHKYGRYQLATALLRRETVSFITDFEGVVCERGDLIRFTHDVPMWGLTSGRILDIVTENDWIVGAQLDEAVTMEAGKNYTIRFRRARLLGMEQTATVVFREGEQTQIAFTPVPLLVNGSQSINKGDVFWFGETGLEHRNLRLHAKTFEGADFECRLICLEDNAAIYDADKGPIPPYDPGISSNISVLWPRVLSMRSDGTVVFRSPNGTYDNRILITYAHPSGTMAAQLSAVEARFRRVGTETWQISPPAMVQFGEISLREVDGLETYEIQLRFVRKDGTRGVWSPVQTHTVVADDGVPPDVTYFVVTRTSDGTRRFEWWMVLEPADVIAGGGYRIKYQSGTSFDWATATPATTAGLISSSPWETNDIAAGTWTFGIKAVTASGAESTAARTITVTLGDPRLRGVLMQRHEHLEGWLGTYVDCTPLGEAPQYLYAGPAEGSRWESQGTWASLSGTRWIDLPRVSPISYATPTIDPADGRNLSYTPKVEVVAGGTITIEMRTRTAAQGTDFTGVSWVPLGRVEQAAYLQIRVTAGGPKIERVTLTLDGNIEIDDIEDIDTLNTNQPWYQRLGVGWFRVAARKDIAALTGAAIRAVQSNGTSWTWQLVSKSAAVGGNPNPAAEFKLYNAGVLTDALVDVELKGPVL